MIVSSFFDHVNAAYRGTDDDAPVAGTPDHTLWLLTTNRKIHEYATDPDTLWRSRFDPNRSIGTISAGTQSYDLDDDFFAPSDEVVITCTDGSIKRYPLVPPQERGSKPDSTYVSGQDPQQVTFYDTIVAGAQIVGGTFTVPGYFIPDDLANESDTILVDDPFWLVYEVASDLASNDLTYESKTADLQLKANNRWDKMRQANRRGTSGNPRTARYSVDRIPGSSR